MGRPRWGHCLFQIQFALPGFDLACSWMYLWIRSSSKPTVLTKYPVAQKCSPVIRRSRSISRCIRTALRWLPTGSAQDLRHFPEFVVNQTQKMTRVMTRWLLRQRARQFGWPVGDHHGEIPPQLLRMREVSVQLVIESHNIERLLRHLGEPLEPPKRAPARDPPYFQSQVLRRVQGAALDPRTLQGWVMRRFVQKGSACRVGAILSVGPQPDRPITTSSAYITTAAIHCRCTSNAIDLFQ